MFSFRGQEVGARVDVGMKRKVFFSEEHDMVHPVQSLCNTVSHQNKTKSTSLENFSTWSFKVMVDSHLCYSSVGT